MVSGTTTHTLPALYTPPVGALGRLKRLGLAAAVIGGGTTLAGAFMVGDQFYHSYLVALVFWTQVALGCLGLTLLNHMTHGAWGIVLRRIFEAAASTLPIFALLFVPVLLRLPVLYIWARPEVVAADPILQAKSGWLSEPFFIARTVIYFAIFIALAVGERRMSLEQDRTGAPAVFHRLQKLSAAGLILFVLACTFASFDWFMSLDPHWFSSIYGVQFVGGAAVGALAFSIVISRFLVQVEPMSRVLRTKHHHDHGTLLFAFLLLWGYFHVSQFVIMWSANLPEEIPFYLRRFHGGWQSLAWVLVLLHFGLPFMLLLSQRIKKNYKKLGLIAALVLFMRWVDLYWQAMPNFEEQIAVHWLDFATLIGIGGVFLLGFARALSGPPLLPLHDPFLEDALHHE